MQHAHGEKTLRHITKPPQKWLGIYNNCRTYFSHLGNYSILFIFLQVAHYVLRMPITASMAL